MEAIGLQRSWENLGLQSLFAPVCSLAIIMPTGEIPSRKKKALAGLENLLSKAENGLNVMTRRGGDASLGPLNASVNAERAYRFLSPALPKDPGKAKKEIREVKRIIKRFIKNESCSDSERLKLRTFCKRVLTYLDREYSDYISKPETSLP